jgi:hypothetical protein
MIASNTKKIQGYRLAENHPEYGHFGVVVNKDLFDQVPFHDKCLFERIGKGSFFTHHIKIEFRSDGRDEMLFLLDSFAQVCNTIQWLVKKKVVHEKAAKFNPEQNENRSFIIDVPGAVIHVDSK